MAKINKSELVEIIAEQEYITKKEAISICDTLFETIKEYLDSGYEVNITNFGSFVPLVKEERVGTDPKTHERITIKSKKTISFRPSIEFKKQLNK